MRQETKRQRKHHEIGKGHPDVEQQRAGHQQRHHQTTLVLIQCRSHKCPNLIKDNRCGEDNRDHKGQFDRGEKGRSNIGGNHGCTDRHLFDQWCGHQLVNIVGEVDRRQKNYKYRNDAVDEALAQLNQMRDQRLSLFYAHVYGLSLVAGDDSGSEAGAAAGTFALSVETTVSGAFSPVS
ncbi:hypothetical protein D3C81_1754440 [compost metagenome]